MKRSIVRVACVFAAAAVASMAFGQWRWKRKTNAVRSIMRAAYRPAIPSTYDRREIAALPPLVRRYFEAVLEDGQAFVTSVSFSQKGEFRQDEHTDLWQPFRATQFVTTQPPGFDWDARIRMAPGVGVWVRDAYVLGAGSLRASVLGAVAVADVQGTPSSARGELMRYLAEAVWYPTALLPSQGVQWDRIDEVSALATLTDRQTTVTLEFRFGADGLVEEVWAASRPRSATESRPWLCRVSGYERHAGMYVPVRGDVEWELPDGPAPYFRGHTTHLNYGFGHR